MDYENKYLKYKNKYSNLKSKVGGYLRDYNCVEPELDKVYVEVFDLFETTYEIQEIVKNLINDNLSSLKRQNAYGPIPSTGWVHNQILIGSKPNTCDDIKSMVDTGKITGFLSLRENNEPYQYCKLEKDNENQDIQDKLCDNLIFLRFRINDYNTPTKVEDTVVAIDNIVNYILRNSNNKIMIHCFSGRGRTGLFTCCVLSIILLLLTPPYQDIMIKIKEEPFYQANISITNLSEKIFKIIQAYIMVNLRAYRKTDWPCIKEIKKMVIPETPAQTKFVKEVIVSYIIRYIENGFLYNNA